MIEFEVLKAETGAVVGRAWLADWTEAYAYVARAYGQGFTIRRAHRR